MARVSLIAVGALNLTGIANLRQIVDDINQCIDLIQDSGDDRIAEILTEIGKGILQDPRLENQARQEVMENLRLLAWEASLPHMERHLGIVKAALAYIPSLLTTSLDIFNYFTVHSGDLRTFFDISG